MGGGSKFILSLPIEKGEVQNVPSAASEVTTERSAQSNGIVLQEGFESVVLLVEDNVELLEMTADSLQQWYRVLKARNGREALELLANEEVNVIVSDIMMPEMDGLELCNKVKSDINYSHIPVILLTAKTTLESKVEGMENGADAYIEKPFLVQQVRLQIENLLKLRHDVRENCVFVFSRILDKSHSNTRNRFLDRNTCIHQCHCSGTNGSH